MTEKRYQVFLSSTYDDLREERLEVVKALLELDCIPCGMEYFPAANEDQWSFIKDLISHCDYYVVIIAGRYGTLHPSGVSYTRMEYEFAIAQNIPTMAFIRQSAAIPAEKRELTDVGRAGLAQFVELVRTKLCKEWIDTQHLAAVVSRGLIYQIKRTPRIGWIRADEPLTGPTPDALQLIKHVDELETELQRARATILDLSRREGAYSVATLTHYMGTFPDYLQNVADLIEKARLEVVVYCDFPAFGSYQAPDYFLSYRQSIERQTHRGVRVKLTCLNGAVRKAALADFISNDNAWKILKRTAHGRLDQYLTRLRLRPTRCSAVS